MNYDIKTHITACYCIAAEKLLYVYITMYCSGALTNLLRLRRNLYSAKEHRRKG